MRVLFLTLYPSVMPSSRYRVYQYLPYLRSQGIDFDVYPAVSGRLFKYLYNTGSPAMNLLYILNEATNRLTQLLKNKSYDIVFIQKSLTTINLRGLPRLLKKSRVIFDVDDNVFHYPISTFSLGFLKTFQDFNQAEYLVSISKAAVVGNHFLLNLANQFNRNAYLIPTSVDTDRFTPVAGNHRQNDDGKIIIGWIGSQSVSQYLGMLAKVLGRLQQNYPLEIRVVGDKNFCLEGVDVKSTDWDYGTEVGQLQEFDIGIMPMPDNNWTRGKCALKALQYMATGIPVVCSPVGANLEIIREGVNGSLAACEEEWAEKLSLLIKNPDLRRKLGMAGRQLAEEKYSLNANAPRLKQVLERAMS